MVLHNAWTVTKIPNDIFKIVVMSKHKIKKSNAASANHTFPYFDTRYFKRGTSVKFTVKSLFRSARDPQKPIILSIRLKVVKLRAKTNP